MALQTLKNELKELLSQGELVQLLARLQSIVSQKSSYYNDLIFHRGKYRRYINLRDKDLISNEEAMREEAKLIEALLHYIDGLQTQNIAAHFPSISYLYRGEEEKEILLQKLKELGLRYITDPYHRINCNRFDMSERFLDAYAHIVHPCKFYFISACPVSVG